MIINCIKNKKINILYTINNMNINCIKNISKNINRFLNNNNDIYIERNRKHNIIDGILYRLYYSKNNCTQEESSIKLGSLKKIKCTRQALSKIENKLPLSFYDKLYSKLTTEINKNNGCKYTKEVIAVDGTYINLLKNLKNYGFKPNTNNNSVNCLNTGLFNVTTNYPLEFVLEKTKNERKSIMDLINNKDIYKNNIFVFDRGYEGNQLFKFMTDHEFLYVCRLKENSKKIADNKKDNIITIDNIKTRIITYTINDKNYYIATNLFDYNIESIKKIYHDRWTIEEYFKYIKTNMKLSKINEKNEENVKKTIYSILIVSKLVYLITNLYKKDDKIINKSILTIGFYDDFLYKFFNNKITTYYFKKFVQTYIMYITKNVRTSFERVCKRPDFKSYYKYNKKKRKKKTE
jgi:hypothetical protein